ncbi:hypothetical protein [Tropicibacter oceani]|uniref:Tetratricopeptide repeat protein n=1 Tax=Tropicibacter oceani TaxID=3058420 RepID=A0ABY8QKG9_9RHOB|nr:hypothetical protein [Tropicibacter oceani]WGW04637.1 hypothetical protein QF118_03545 [Tropicibacter oceani]
MRLIPLFFFALFWPMSAYAQQIIVRGGEHDDFTRLVFDVPAGIQWTLEEIEGANGKRFVLQREGLKFDTTRAFQKIGNARIAALDPVAGRSAIDIRLNCNCTAESFTLRGRMVVFDFRDGADVDALAQAAEPAPSATPSAQDTTLAQDLSTVRIDGVPGIGPNKRPDPLMPSVSVLRPLEPQGRTANAAPATTNPYAVGDSIAADLARAATQGLLEPALRAVPDPAHVTLHSDTPPADTSAGQGPLNDLAAQLAELDPDSSRKGVISIGGVQCASDKKLRIGDWAQADSVLEVLARDRSALFGEFDKVNKQALLNYSRALLHFGFGAEARAVLGTDPEGPDPMLLAISYIVDAENDPTGWFASQANCDTYAAFWAAMSGGVRPEDTRYSSEAILRGLEALPAHLRDHLGPLLAERLSKAGKSDIARDVLRRLERLHGGPTASLALSAAQLELREGNVAKADATLKSIEALPEADAPEAITTAVDIARAKDIPVSAEVAELTEAFAAELKNSEQGPGLWQAHIRSRLLNKEFARSFQGLQDAEGIPADMLRDTTIEVFKAIAEQSDDLEFLKYAMGGMLESGDLGDPGLDLAIIQRLLALGMPDEALTRLDETPDIPGARDFRLARAQALLALSRPEEAEIVLVGLRGENIAALRAEARRQMGDHDYARTLYEEMGETEEALNAAWLSGDWDRVAEEGETPLAQAARLTSQDNPVPEAPSLGYAETLTGQSAETRQTLRALLDATQIGAGG